MWTRLIVFAMSVSSMTVSANVQQESAVTSFENAPSFANAATMLRRLGHGLQFRQTALDAQKNGINLALFTLVPKNEQWMLVLPQRVESGQTGLLVWLASNDDGHVPQAVREAALNSGLAVISAMDGGEKQPLIERRAALALIGAYGYGKTHAVDPGRIFVGGTGPSAELAILLAMGYPDIFSGVLAIDGAASIGSQEVPVPLHQLLSIARNRSDIAFVATNAKARNEATSAASSFHDLCIPGARVYPVDDALSTSAMSVVLQEIEGSASFTQDEGCLSNVKAGIERGLADLANHVNRKQWPRASDLLLDLHLRYGGLVEAEVVENWDRIVPEYQNLSLQAAEHLIRSPSNLKQFIAPKPLPRPKSQ